MLLKRCARTVVFVSLVCLNARTGSGEAEEGVVICESVQATTCSHWGEPLVCATVCAQTLRG